MWLRDIQNNLVNVSALRSISFASEALAPNVPVAGELPPPPTITYRVLGHFPPTVFADESVILMETRDQPAAAAAWKAMQTLILGQ